MITRGRLSGRLLSMLFRLIAHIMVPYLKRLDRTTVCASLDLQIVSIVLCPCTLVDEVRIGCHVTQKAQMIVDLIQRADEVPP